MPKGIYPRGNRSQNTEPVISVPTQSQNFNSLNKGGMRTEFTEAPVTPETANASVVNVVSQSGDESEMSTTARLFGDLLDGEENAIAPQEIGVPVPVSQSPDDGIQPVPVLVQPEQQSQIKEDSSFDIEKVLNRKVKAKIDGKEEEVTLKELRDSYQINKHLAQAADKVGEERRKLAEERRQLQELRQSRTDQYTEPEQQPATSYNPIPKTREAQWNDPVLQRIQFLESQLQQLAQGTQPVIFQSNRQRVADELRGQGFDDFMNYIPKMEAHLTGIKDQQLVNFYDTPQGSKALYFQLKAQDLNQRTPVPIQAPNQNIAPPATRVDSGSQPNGSMNDDGASNYRRAFKRAVDVGNDSALGREAWNQVLIQKGIIPGD